VIPQTIDGITVTELFGYKAPAHEVEAIATNNLLKSNLSFSSIVTDPTSLLPFSSQILKSVIIPNTVEKISGTVFSGSRNLTSIKLSNKLTSVNSSIFSNCTSLVSVELPSSVLSIDQSAFEGCTSLKEVKINEGLTSIGNNAFYNCTALETINLPNSVTTIGNDIFYNCSKIKGEIDGNLNYIGNDSNHYIMLINSTSKDIESATINQNTKFIADNAFQNCSKLNAVNMPNTISYIGKRAFSGCNSLIEISLPSSITSISESSFSGSGLNYVTIPEGVEYIDSYAFVGCKNLTKIILPTTLNSINYSAFRYTYALAEIYNLSTLDIKVGYNYGYETGLGYCAKVIHKSLSENSLISEKDGIIYYTNGTYISALTPKDRNISSVTLKEGTKNVETGAFCGCSNLRKLIIPSTLTSMGYDSYEYYGSFDRCNLLVEVYNLSNLNIVPGTNYNKSGLGTFVKVVHKNLSDPSSISSINGILYLTNNGDKSAIGVEDKSISNVVLDNDTTSIASYAFSNYTSLSSITIQNNVTKIEDYAFYGCSNLSSITIPNSVITIGSSAFSGCNNLPSITIPDSVTTIGSSAFSMCSSLKSVTFSNQLTSLSVSMFSSCSSLTTITIPSTIKSIGNNAFYNCKLLTSITLNEGLETIGSSSFEYCDGLRSLTIPTSVTNIGDYAFEETGRSGTLLINILNNSSVITAGTNLFYNAYNFTINVPTNLLSAYQTATNWSNYSSHFSGKVILNGISYNLSNNNYYVSSILDNSITSIDIPSTINGSNVIISGFSAFSNCNNLQTINIDSNNANYSSYDGCIYSKDGTTLMYAPNGKTTLELNSTINNFWSLSNCTKLVKITICAGGNTNYSVYDDALYSGDGTVLIYVPLAKTSLILKDTTKSVNNIYILPKEFYFVEDNVKYLKSSSSNYFMLVSVLDPNATLTSFTIKDSTKLILVDTAFNDCTNLESIIVSSSNEIYSSYDNCLYTKDGQSLLFVPNAKTTIELNSTVNNIYGVYNTSNLQSISICSLGNENYITYDGALYSNDGTDLLFVPTAKESLIVKESLEYIDCDIPEICLFNDNDIAVYLKSANTKYFVLFSVNNTVTSFVIKAQTKIILEEFNIESFKTLPTITVEEGSTSFKIENNCLMSYDGNSIILCLDSTLTEFTITSNIINIAPEAFIRDVNLLTITIDSSTFASNEELLLFSSTLNSCSNLYIKNTITTISSCITESLGFSLVENPDASLVKNGYALYQRSLKPRLPLL
jgi:hypothetical protein